MAVEVALEHEVKSLRISSILLFFEMQRGGRGETELAFCRPWV